MKSCDKYEVLHSHLSLGFEDVHCVITPLISNTLLESKIQSDTAYKKQQQTLIVWTKGWSFQERAGCDKICAVQGKDPSVHFTQNLVQDSEDDRGFGVISESAAPFELLVAELVKFEKTSELVSSCLSIPEGEAGYLLEKY